MYPYWLLFGYFALGALWESLAPQPARGWSRLGLALGILFTVLLVGLRYRVGGDWGSYLYYFKAMRFGSFTDAISWGDPAYQAVNFLVYRLGGEIWGVNLICAALFVWGLTRFAFTQRNPWLVFLIASPYLINVVATGYTRQSVAIGFLLAGLAAVIRGRGILTFALYVVAAALFHRTAICAFPLVLFVWPSHRFLNTVAMVGISALLYIYLAANSLDFFMQNYVEAHYSSQGASLRVGMAVIAALIFLLEYQRFQFDDRQRRIWTNYSLMSLLAFVLLVVTPSSTAVDRASLYLIPLQLATFARVPYAFTSRAVGTAIVIGYYGVIQFVWLNYAVYARWFVPYQWYNPFT